MGIESGTSRQKSPEENRSQALTVFLHEINGIPQDVINRMVIEGQYWEYVDVLMPEYSAGTNVESNNEMRKLYEAAFALILFGIEGVIIEPTNRDFNFATIKWNRALLEE